MAIDPVEIEELESKAGNIYEAVVVAAKRARQINDETKLEYNQRVEPLQQTETDDETLISKDKMNISVDFEKRIKPTEQGLAEILDDQLEFRIRGEQSPDDVD
jgi:DNA-directed RNA polymerase omega subunit